MTELSTSTDTVAPPDLAPLARPLPRRSSGHRPQHPLATVPPAPLTASLTDLSRMVTRVHATCERNGMEPGLDLRLAGVMAELDSLIHDLLQDADSVPNDAQTPPTRAASSDVAGGSDRAHAEATFEAWLTSDDQPDVSPVDPPGEPQTSLTKMLGELLLSRRQLPADTAAEFGMPPGSTQGHAATVLLLAVNDPAGPQCRSYRSALSYMRDQAHPFVSQ